MNNPVRIYVIHHPDSEVGPGLTNLIYDWFRLQNREGIPVYIRSMPPPRKKVPIDPAGTSGCLEYLVPLVDARMVRDVAWHDYLKHLMERCLSEGNLATSGWVMFPVALDGTAFNLPPSVTQRNFIRYQVSPLGGSPSAGGAVLDSHAVDVVLKDLTEAISHDLNQRIFPSQAGRKLKIFISYARADGAAVPKAIREYVSSQTQCETFFDENDISFGSKYDDVLKQNAGEQARALIVVEGDHYAERPICRWEIRKFTQPVKVRLDKGRKMVHAFHPVIVVNTMSGPVTSRVLPELGQATSMRWEPGREMHCFSVLMRAVLFGTRNILAARHSTDSHTKGLVVNRLPGPVAIQRLLEDKAAAAESGKPRPQIHYPGNGLPLIELRLLQSTFKNLKLTAFRDVSVHLPSSLNRMMKARKRPFHEQVIGISSGHSDQLASMGYLERHIEESLIYLLRPLLRLGADVMYGGKLPKPEDSAASGTRNMTLALMNLVNDELSIAGVDGVDETSTARTIPSRLFNPTSWPGTKRITPRDEATWISTCSLVPVLPGDVGLKGPEPMEGSPHYLAWQGMVLSRSREMMAEGFNCPVFGNPERRVFARAMVFVCGRMSGFSGSMPGIMEEFYWALKHARPVYLMGGFGGAAGVLADGLIGKSRQQPPLFTCSHYAESSDSYSALLSAYRELDVPPVRQPQTCFDALWQMLLEGRKTGISRFFRNGLSEEQNMKLLTTDSTNEAVHLIWAGLAALNRAKGGGASRTAASEAAEKAVQPGKRRFSGSRKTRQD